MNPDQIKQDENFLCGLELEKPGLSVYLVYKGGKSVQYYAFLNNDLLFSGNDFRPAPSMNQDSIDAVISLLSFLCLQPGDTDNEYFKNYNHTQMDWTKSQDCEQLKMEIGDFEHTASEYHKEAKEFFEKRFIIP